MDKDHFIRQNKPGLETNGPYNLSNTQSPKELITQKLKVKEWF